MSNDNQATGHNLDTSEGARAYVAEFFANQVGRHDFRAYITTRLAADFACALAQHLAARPSLAGQGDVRAQFESWVAPRRVIHGFNRVEDMWDAWKAALAARQPVGEPVAYLDLGAGGYMDVGTDLSDEALAELPKGRHMLGIIGTYGVDGYKPAQAVDLGQFRAQVAELLRREFDLEVADPEDHRHDDGAGEADRIASAIAALIDSKGAGNG